MKREDGSWDVFEDYVLDFAIDCAANGGRYALVTLVGIEGSSPRSLGAQMAVSESGSFVGYLSGGCIERAIVSEALDALLHGQNRLVRYGQGSRYFDIQLPCGSGVDLYFDVSQPTSLISAIDLMLAQRRDSRMEISLPGNLGRAEQSFAIEYMPRRRMVIAGGGPSTVRLCSLAKLSGFDVEVWSADESTRENAKCLHANVVELVSPRKSYEITADSRTAIVFMFHDHLWEDNLIPSALATNAYYIGAMGSKGTHAKRCHKLLEKGFSPDEISRISGPAGIFGGAKSASDIAVSILADVVKEEHGKVAAQRDALSSPRASELHADDQTNSGRRLS